MWAVCIQLTHLSYDDCENTRSLSCCHHQVGSMTHSPLFRVRSWNIGMRRMSLNILNGSDSGLLPDGTKPLPESMLTNHQWDLVAFTWGYFDRKCLRYLSLIWVSKLLIWNYCQISWRAMLWLLRDMIHVAFKPLMVTTVIGLAPICISAIGHRAFWHIYRYWRGKYSCENWSTYWRVAMV